MENAKIHNCGRNDTKLGVNVYFFIPSNILNDYFGIWAFKDMFWHKTDFCIKNQDKSWNPVVAKCQKWPRILGIDPLKGPRGLVSFANFLTPLGTSR